MNRRDRLIFFSMILMTLYFSFMGYVYSSMAYREAERSLQATNYVYGLLDLVNRNVVEAGTSCARP
jgi:hypothetical protein